MAGGFPHSFPIPFTATAVKTMRSLLSEDIGDVIFGSNTSTTTADGNAGGTTLIDSTLMALPSGWFRFGSGGEQPTAVKITSGLYSGEVRYVNGFDNTNGTVTVSSSFGGQIEDAITFEVHRIAHPALKDACIEAAAKDSFPYLYDYVDSTAIVFGDILIDGSLESWSTSTSPAYWTAVGPTVTRTSSYAHDSVYGAALSTTTGYVGQSSTNNPDLLKCGGLTPTFYKWVRAGSASQVRLAIYDGTTLTYGDYNTTTGAYELLSVTAKIKDNPSDVAFRIYYDVNATTAYIDDGIAVGAYDKYDYDISNLGLINDTPDQVFTLSSASDEYPRPSGLATPFANWKMAPNGFIRFTGGLNNGTRLRIIGRKYLSVNDATTATVAAGAVFTDLTDVDIPTYTGHELEVLRINAAGTGIESVASSSAAHAIGGAMHTASTMAELITMVSDETPATTDDIAAHSALDTGVHGVGASTVASAASLTTHAALTTTAHGATGTIMNTTDHLDDTAGGTTGETGKGATSNALYGHTAGTTGHGATGAVMGTTNTQTVTNKTFTTPVIASLYQDAGKTLTVTMPAATDTLVGKATTDTLTNKTLSASVASGTWTSSSWGIPAGALNPGGYITIGSVSYFGAVLVPSAVITEDHATSSLFNAAATTDSKAIWTSPTGSMILGMKMRLVEKFAGTGLSAFNITLGVGGGDVDAYLVAGTMNLFSDDLNEVYYTKGAGYDAASGILHSTASTTVTATATSTGCNMADLTAGTVTFEIAYICYGKVMT
jgi:hypothetical protein